MCRTNPANNNSRTNPSFHRFTVVFDREGIQSDLSGRDEEEAALPVLTYHKHPGEDWPRQEFFATPVRLASGQETTMQLAERGTRLSNQLWLREIRKPEPEAVARPRFSSTD